MKVRELIKQLMEMPMDAEVELEVFTSFGSDFSEGDAGYVEQISDRRVLIGEKL